MNGSSAYSQQQKGVLELNTNSYGNVEINIHNSNVFQTNNNKNNNKNNIHTNANTNSHRHHQRHHQHKHHHQRHPQSQQNYNYNNRPLSKASKGSKYSTSTGTSSKDSIQKIVIRQYLSTPDVVEVNGWRLPKEVAEYALANDLTEDQLYDYEGRLLEQERLDEIEFQRRRAEIVAGWNTNSSLLPSCCTYIDTGDIKNQLDSATLDDLEKDVRLRLPPRSSRFWYFGSFQHNWRNRRHQGQDRLDTPYNNM